MIKKIINNEDKKRLLANFISLSSLQAVNYILPLITFPYLIRTLGIEKFGLLAFASATITYFNIITDYGFNLTATRAISININRDKIQRINQIFSSVMIIKFALMLLSFFLLCLLVFSFEKFRNEALIYFLTFGTVIGQVLFPVWFFQGMERMKYITYLNIISKVIFTLSIFVFVKQQSDYYLVPLLTSLGFLIAAFWSLVIIKKEFRIKFSFQKFVILKYYLLDGWYIFITSVFSSFYRSSNIMILGFITNNTFVGYYSIVEKIIKIIQSLQDVLGRTFFPYFSKKFNKNKKSFFELNNKIIKYIVVYYAFITLLVFVFSPLIVKILTNSYNVEIIRNLKVSSFVIFFGGLSYYYGILGLITLNYKKEFTKYIINTGIFNLMICSLASYFYKDFGASLTFSLSEIFLFIQIFYKINQIKKELI